MPNRVIKEGILRSDKVNGLSWCAEILFRRLMSVVDDFGRYDARPSIIRSSIYPLKLEKVSEADVLKWMNECSEAEVISLYEVKQKPYLEIIDFGQTIRIKKQKYPPPENLQADASRCKQMQADACLKPIQSETESESKTETEITPTAKIKSPYWFKCLNVVYEKKVSEFVENDLQSFYEVQLMQHSGQEEIIHKALSKLDLDYNSYSFNNPNHIQNTFRTVLEKEKSSAKKEKENGQHSKSYNNRQASLDELTKLTNTVLQQPFTLNDNNSGHSQ